MALSNVRIPVEVSFITFHDDDFPATAVAEYRKESASTPSAAHGSPSSPSSGGKSRSLFALTTGSFPQEIILTTRSSFANLKRIELTLDEAKDIVVERCVAAGERSATVSPRRTNGSGSSAGSGSAGNVEPMSAKFEVVGERQLARGEEVKSAAATGESSAAAAGKRLAAAAAAGKDDDLTPRKKQVEVLQLDPTGAGKGIRAIKLRILSGYSDFVGIYGIELYGEESEQRMAVLESKAEVSM